MSNCNYLSLSPPSDQPTSFVGQATLTFGSWHSYDPKDSDDEKGEDISVELHRLLLSEELNLCFLKLTESGSFIPFANYGAQTGGRSSRGGRYGSQERGSLNDIFHSQVWWETSLRHIDLKWVGPAQRPKSPLSQLLGFWAFCSPLPFC